MIIAKMSGGLGNQLFQYAAARALSQSMRTSLRLDCSWYLNIRASDTSRSFELGTLGITVTAASLYDTFRRRVAKRLVGAGISSSRLTGMTYVSEERGAVPLLSRPWAGDVYLDGYWQDYSYAKAVRTLLLKEISPSLAALAPNAGIDMDELAETEAVAVHIRRGDYVSSASIQAKHGVCGEQYYHQSIALMEERIPNARFLFFSDDIPWCRDHFAKIRNAIFINAQGRNSSLIEFALMQRCKHFVIANSTFSWWAAFLGQRPRSHVIAPAKWFAAESLQTANLLPPDWGLGEG